MLGVKQFAPDIFFSLKLISKEAIPGNECDRQRKLMSGLSSQQADESKRKHGTNEQAKKETESL